jgi:alkylation response protein AidB-like acyl-CoA dehydrogenase
MKVMDKERQMIRTAAEKTAQRIVQPRAAKIDTTGEFPWDLVEAFGKQGFLSLLLPEQYGGTNGDLTHSVLLSKGAEGLRFLLSHPLGPGVGTLPILLGGNSS